MRMADREMLRRLIHLVENDVQSLADSDFACPVSEFVDEERYKSEYARLFRRIPLIVGHASQVPNAGDFFTHSETGQPILVTRGGDGTVRAFLNVCRHRGAIIETEREGQGRKAFRCPYHSWAYDLRGKLVAIPGRDGFPSCLADTHDLVELCTAVRHGLIFVVPEAGRHVDIDAHLGELGDHLAAFGVERFHFYRTDEIAAPFNWKIAVDGGIETYHLPTVHPTSLSAHYLGRQTHFETIGNHGRFAIPKRTVLDLKVRPDESWNILDQALLSYLVFPNTIMLIARDHLICFSVFPQKLDRTIVLNSTYVSEPPGQRTREKHWKAAADFSRKIVSEDFSVNETMQAAIASGANAAYLFGRFEPGLSHFHTQINAALAR